MTKVLRPIAASVWNTVWWPKPYYLKVTTHVNKVTKLAVDKIEEVTVDGATSTTAKAPDLVQRMDNQFNENYVHYIAKPKLMKVMSLQFQRTSKAMQVIRLEPF